MAPSDVGGQVGDLRGVAIGRDLTHVNRKQLTQQHTNTKRIAINAQEQPRSAPTRHRRLLLDVSAPTTHQSATTIQFAN
eukprot:768411-Hanusia_phi.AAC.9